MTPDLINGLFEFGGAIAQAQNVRALCRDKSYLGVVPAPFIFFFCWGLWNLFYYPSLNQMFSFTGGLALVITNGLYLLMMVRFRRRPVEKSA